MSITNKSLGRQSRFARRHGHPETPRQTGHPLVAFEDWIETQPGSTRRGVTRGNFQIPNYVVQAI